MADSDDRATHCLLNEDGEIWLTRRYLATSVADAHFTELACTTPWRRETVRVFGRQHLQPRCTAWFGDAAARYRYSGLILTPHPWTPLLAALRDRIAMACTTPFDSVLLSRYHDGNDAIAPHSDDEPELGAMPVIATLSLGAPRILRLTHRHDRAQPALAIALTHGSLLVMRGATQHNYRHGIARTRTTVGERISLTFRRVVGQDSSVFCLGGNG